MPDSRGRDLDWPSDACKRLQEEGGSPVRTTAAGTKLSYGSENYFNTSRVERQSPQHHYRPRHGIDGAKMRASVRMTRYLESWGAAKPFAHLHHRDSMTTENGKINTTQCSKKASALLMWILKFSGIIANKPWPRITLTMTTTALILIMAVFNMFFLEDNLISSVPVLNTSNESVYNSNGQALRLIEKNNFYLPVSTLDSCFSVFLFFLPFSFQ
ncbi:UNVERIFIED_CONTAM: hypothetical protein FKN15_054063 [Acipenser sinensis]